MSFDEGMELVVRGFEIGGVVVLVVGSVTALVRAVRSWRRDGRAGVYEQARRDVGRAILLGLELLVAADIVRTVAVEPTLTSVAVLALIVLVRTFLSFSLEVELEGRWPWQRASAPDRSEAGVGGWRLEPPLLQQRLSGVSSA